MFQIPVTLKDPIERGLKVLLPKKVINKLFTVTLKDPIERGLKACDMLLVIPVGTSVTLKDPIERGLKGEYETGCYERTVKGYTQRPDRKGTERLKEYDKPLVCAWELHSKTR